MSGVGLAHAFGVGLTHLGVRSGIDTHFVRSGIDTFGVRNGIDTLFVFYVMSRIDTCLVLGQEWDLDTL